VYQTTEELAAGVTPSDLTRAEGDDRRYATFADFCKVASRGVPCEVNADHTIAAALELTGDAVITVRGRRSLRATASMTHILRHSGELTIVVAGEWLLDGDGNATTGLHSTAKLPRANRLRLLDLVNGWNTGPNVAAYEYGVDGDGLLEDCVAENCSNIGFSARGNTTLASQTARMVLKNCRTKGTTGNGNLEGAGIGYLLLIAGMLEAVTDGGNFTGHANARVTNGYKCSSAQARGSYYHDTGRGPTMGEETVNFIIAGNVCRDISGNGCSADTTTGSGSIDGFGVIDGNVCVRCARAVRTTCSNVSVTNNRAIECTSAGAAFTFGGAGFDVWVHGNDDYSATASRISFYVLENSRARMGLNHTNATARNAYTMEAGSSMVFSSPGGEVRTLTANGDLSVTDRIVVLDGTSNTVDLDLFDASEVQATAFECVVLKKDLTNSCTITFQGGAAHGETINGATSLTLPASHKYRGVRLFCLDGPAGTWIATPVMPATTYTVTNPTSDRTYDADTVAVAELADIVATILQDLALR
jgi:hypothetical protein